MWSRSGNFGAPAAGQIPDLHVVPVVASESAALSV